MSSRIAAALSLLLSAATAHAQHPEARSAGELRVLLARADAQVVEHERRRSEADAASAPRRSARRVTSGDLVVLLWSAVPPAMADAMVRAADSALSTAAVVPPELLRARVFLMPRTTDTAAVLTEPDLARRRRVLIEGLDFGDITAASAPRITSVVGREFAATLDPVWRAWLPFAPDLAGPRRELVTEAARRDLVQPDFAVAAQCLAGRSGACRLWMGLDADSAPYRSRYTPAELRRIIGRGGYGRSTDVSRCIRHDDEACIRVAGAGASRSGIPAVPAAPNARLSLLLAIRDLHGVAAMRRALADSAGPIGQRLARASGSDPDAFVLAWRRWLLAGGARQHVRAGAGDLIAAAAAAGLLLFLATRSGRWTR